MSNGDPIKPDSTQDESHSAANFGGGSKSVNPLPGAGNVAVNQADETSHKTGETDKPTQPSQQDILDRIRAGELWMIVFTAVVALTTVAQFVQSGCNNRNTSKQVDKIIGAANTQACAARQIAAASDRNAAAADRFSGTADGIDTKIKAVESDFAQMARNSSDSLKQSLQIFQAANRPWLTMTPAQNFTPQIPGSAPLDVVVQNVGPSPAFQISNFYIDYDVLNIAFNGSFALPAMWPGEQNPGGNAFVPGETGSKSIMVNITPEQSAEMSLPMSNYHIVVFGRVDYWGRRYLGKESITGRFSAEPIIRKERCTGVLA